jgi:hypothetical protein
MSEATQEKEELVSDNVETKSNTTMVSPSMAAVRKTVLIRKSAMQNPFLSDATRRTKLAMRNGEVKGRLKFIVQQSKLLVLPPTIDGHEFSIVAKARETLCRRFTFLHPSRMEDDDPYTEAVKQGNEVTVITALPQGYSMGGWRCHAKLNSSEGTECLHPNGSLVETCNRCNHPKPKLRQEFAYLRLMTPGVRRQRKEYERIMKGIDSEFVRCDLAEHEAREKVAAYDKQLKLLELNGDVIDEETWLMMDVDLVNNVWQRVNARTLLPLIAERRLELGPKLATARGELAILIQSAYQMAVIHVQRVGRRYLVRLRLNDVRQSVINFARFSAAVEIQRIARTKLAYNKAECQRKIRNNCMAIRIQCFARRMSAWSERRRLHDTYMIKLRNSAATLIQSILRSYACKLQLQHLREERRLLLETKEKARVEILQHHSATIIQKHCRRMLAIAKCEQKQIELGLHLRLLMYIERFVVDGCMFSFIKSINDDYIRYERTITSTIEREEKLAQTFVEKVINARDGDHSTAWQNYIELAHGVESSAESATELDDVKRHPCIKDKFEIYGGGLSRRRDQKGTNTNRITSRAASSQSGGRHETNRLIKNHGGTGPSKQEVSYQEEEDRLISLQQKKDRIRGHYLLFDIPHGLDDTVMRFITAVTLRYEFDDPSESCVSGSHHSNRSDKDHHHQCMTYADPIIKNLHSRGIVFIRQLLPAMTMSSILSSIEGVTDEFVLLSCLMLNVLQQMQGGSHLNRKYLQATCRQCMDTQKEITNKAGVAANATYIDPQKFYVASLLGETAAEDYNDDDNPGGLWRQHTPARLAAASMTRQEVKSSSSSSSSGSGIAKKGKSWVTSYTAKILSENETKNPAIRAYRHGKLLDRHSSTNPK